MTTNQHAYRKGASTQTALYEVFSVAQSALSKRGGGICVAVFLDISGAFDATWHFGILHKLLEYGVPKYLVAWTKSFLDSRSAYFSESGEVHEVSLTQGCPQGGVLSPILWNVLFNEMLGIPVEKSKVRNDVMKVIGYADDAVIICKASSIEDASEMINKQLSKIYEWSIMNRVKFNPTKLAALTISNKINRPKATDIYYNGVRVNEVTSYKYLGLLVDNKGMWNLHITSTLSKLALITKSLRGLACGREGLSLDVFKILFHSIFMPVMLYGIAIWGWKAQAKTTCIKFDKEIRRFGLMATRCQKSTPNVFVFSLLGTQCFSSILQNEVLKTSIQQFHVIGSARQSVYETYCKNRKIREVPQCMDQYYYMLRRDVSKNILNVKFDDVNELFRIHPSKWVSTRTIIHSVEDAIVLGSDNRGWVVYTDASASSYGVGWSFVALRQGYCKFKNNGALTRCSIFVAEAYAVLQALKYVNTLTCLSKTEIIEIRSDAQGLVRCLQKPCFANKVLAMIKDEMRAATFSGKNIVLRWVPGHSDIMGNDFADTLAKKAIDMSNVTKVNITQEDVKCELKKKIREEEEKTWEQFGSRIIKEFLPDRNMLVKFIKSSPSAVLTEIVSGHTRLNEFLCSKLGKIQSTQCRCGECAETVHHFLFECSLHDDVRKEIWENFEPTYEFVTKDWYKLNQFVLQTRRFDRIHWEELGEMRNHN